MIVDIITSLLILVGAAFALVGSIGLARLPDFFTRLHAPTKATTLGVGSIVIASLIHSSAATGGVSLRELAISLFLFITAPVSAHLLAKAALDTRARSSTKPKEIPMGHIDPTREVFAQFRADDRPGPIHMLNLVRLRAQAAYPDGRQASGAEAYAAYGRESGPVFERLGGRIVWQGRFELMLIGPQDERWDHCFIAEYPSVAAFAEMIRDPVYREAVKHRQAAVEDSRLIRHAVLPAGKTFGEIPT